MPRITKVYTRTGDDGTTSLATGKRVRKDSLRIEAYGTVDELSSAIGVARASGLMEPLDEFLEQVQNNLFHLGSDLCVPEDAKEALPVPKIERAHVESLEHSIDELTEDLPALENFILPGGSLGAAHLHQARTICRRAERALVRLLHAEPIGPFGLRYLNRLSDWLFVAARFENRNLGVEDVLWDSRRKPGG